MSFVDELKRRNVLRVGIAYAVAAWLTIQIVETVSPAFGYGDAVLRIVVVVLGIGFLPALIFAWAFEITPEGLKKEKDVDRSHSIAPQTGKKLDRIIIAALAIALVYFAFDKFLIAPQLQLESAEEARQAGRSEAFIESFGDNSIAVLPFVNMSDDSSNEYFSDGISEELLNVLAKIPELRVISRSSAFAYKDKDINVVEVGRELNVAHILEGSVRKAGDQVRITVQLIEAATDTHLWSETYDRSLEDIFAVQDEIAALVVDNLKLKIFDSSPTVTKTDPQAYAKYLQAVHLSDVVTAESLDAAITLFKQVIETDPNYLPAWIGLGTAYTRSESILALPAEEARALYREALTEAARIAPNSAKVHDRIAWDYFKYRNDYAMAASHYERALELEPTNTDIIGNVSMFLTSLGRLEDSIVLGEFQIFRDPANPVAYNNMGIRYRFAGQLQKALMAFETAQALNPSLIGIDYEIGLTYLQMGEFLESIEAFKSERLSVFSNIGLAMAYYESGDKQESDQRLSSVVAEYGDRIPYYIASIYAYRGENDEAFEWLAESAEAGDYEFDNVINDPILSGLHSDSRWLQFLESTEKSPEKMAAIEFDIPTFE